VVVDKNKDVGIAASLTRAIELAEEGLERIARITAEGIRFGLETNGHVEAAERNMRDALRQLVLAERELRRRPGLEAIGERPEGIVEVVPRPEADAASGGV